MNFALYKKILGLLLAISLSTFFAIDGYSQCLDVSWDAFAATCGQMDGHVIVSANDGVPPFEFVFPDGTTEQSPTGFFDWFTSSGTFVITVTDANGCAGEVTVVVGGSTSDVELTFQPNIIMCNGECADLNLSISSTCSGANFLWTGPNGFTSNDQSPSTCNPGVYEIQVFDCFGCVTTESIVVTAAMSSLQVNVQSTTDVLCGSDCIGAAVINTIGGTPPYSYEWSNGQNGPNATGLCPGVHNVTVWDSNGCSDATTIEIFEIGNSFELESFAITFCEGDCLSLPVNVIGGCQPFVYQWTGPNGFVSTLAEPTVCTSGIYTLSVIDCSGCSKSVDYNVERIPLPVINVTNVTPSNCNNDCTGAIDIEIIGGQPGMQISWSNGATTEDISGLCEGVYSLEVISAEGCVTFNEVIVVCEVNDIELVFTEGPPMCEGMCNGFISVAVDGGVPPYQFNWSNGQLGELIDDLCAGSYNVTIVDAFGNIGFNESPVVLENSDELLYEVNTTAISCTEGGTIEVDVLTGSTDNIFTLNGVFVPSNIMTNVLTRNNVIHVEDAGTGCTATFEVILDPPFELVVSGTMPGCETNNGTATATVNNSSSTYNYLWSNGATTSTITGLAPGGYSVTVTDANNGCETNDHINIEKDPICFVKISGYVIDDSDDLDCMTTAMINGVPLQLISLNDGEQYTYTDENGYFSFQTDPGTHTLVYESLTLRYNLICADPITLTAANIGDEVGGNFYVQINDFIDLSINIVKGPMRPGFDHYVFANIHNAASPVSSGEVSVNYDVNESFISADPAPTSIDETNRIITWNFDSMEAASSAIYSMLFSLDPSVSLGTEITIGGTVNPTTNDIDPDNNVNSCTGIVMGSYDPNDKSVFHDGEIWDVDNNIIWPNSTDNLTYLVRFQNTGTDTAFTVVIEDELDAKFNIRDISPGPASHAYTLDVRDGNILEFTFDNILLPDSTTNEAASHGHVFFDVKIAPNFPIGESILNDAAIFFDFNSPIITNEVVTTFDFWLATDEVDQFIDLQLYPNPTKGDIILSFSLEESGATTIEVLDIYGKTVQQLMQNESLYAGDYQLSLVEKSLLPGTYFVKMNSGNKTAIEKLVMIQ